MLSGSSHLDCVRQADGFEVGFVEFQEVVKVTPFNRVEVWLPKNEEREHTSLFVFVFLLEVYSSNA